jgi:hypothetical protein
MPPGAESIPLAITVIGDVERISSYRRVVWSQPFRDGKVDVLQWPGSEMTYQDQWKALSGRIRGLMQAAHLHARFLSVRSSDTYGSTLRILEQIEQIRSSLQTFRSSFQHTLSPAALVSIENFVNKSNNLVIKSQGGQSARQERVWAALVLLGAFETEMSFILSDIQQSIRARSELAFSHLQRLIVVDQEFRTKWHNAFEAGEVACEKLAATHLLLHGIFAFKVDAAGARTDLVFQEPAGNFVDERRYVDGFVLTEWKKASSDRDAAKQFEQARSQARHYAQGALAGSELTAYRYAVVVSRRQVTPPADLAEGEVVYRHVNVAIEPGPPSRARRDPLRFAGRS